MFTQTWPLIAGLLAAGLPVVIHWLTRPRPVRLPISTLRFIRGAVEEKRAAYRLRDWIVLLLRTAAILLIAMAVARPLLNQRVAAAPDDEPSATTRIVLLDCSQSMAARVSGVAHFERARPVVLKALQPEPSLRANLFLAGTTPNPVFDQPSSNLRVLRDGLQSAAVLPQRLRVQPALNVIAEMLSVSGSGERLELLIVSDFQRSNWSTADFSVLPQNCEIRLHAVTEQKEIPNLAITGASTIGRVEAGRESEFSVEVANSSATPRHVRVELTLESVTVPFEGHVPPHARTVLGRQVPTIGSGWQQGLVEIVGQQDALPADDRRSFTVAVHEQPRMQILSRTPPKTVATSAWFLQRAILATHSVNGESSRLEWTDAADPNIETLRSAEVVAIVRPGRLSRQTSNVLAAMLERGTSVLYVASEPLDAANLKDLSDALGTSARLPVEFVPLPSQRGGTRRFLTDVERHRPPFSGFGDELATALHTLEFRGGLLSRPVPDGIREDLRGTLNDQSAFLVITSAGRGKLAVMNVDLERSNLALTAVFVPLLGELIAEELATGEQIAQQFPSGEPFSLTLPVGEERIADLSIVGPDDDLNAEARGRLSASPSGVVWQVQQAGPPGIYQIMLDGQSIASIATTIPAEESDLRNLPTSVFEGRLSGGRRLTTTSGNAVHQEEYDTTWAWLAVACLFCLLGELLTLRMFRV